MIFVDNIKNFLSKNIKLIISLLVIIGIGIIGYTLAAPKLTNVSIATGNYQVVYSGTATLPSSKLTPILDDELTSSSNSTKVMKVTFTVKGAQTNPTNVPIIYDVSLTDLNLDSELHSELLKWRLYKNNTQISEGSFSYDFDAQINKRMVLTSIQQDLPSYSSTADSYTFYIWISEQCTGDITSCGEETNTTPLMNKTLSGNIKIELSTKSKKALTRRTGIQPNSPDLVQGLIPVKYDENKNTWVKADSSNTNFSWYDYSEKRWANAVLVSDTGFDYHITSKSVSISNQTASAYASSNQNQDSTTSTSTFTITTGSTAGTLSFNYVVSSESNYDKLTITVNGTTVANAISGEKSDTYSVSATANTTYTIIVKYVKDSSASKGTDTATISNLTYPSGSTLSITPDATYPFNETTLSINKVASGFTYDTSTSMYTLKDSTNDTISSSTIGKYVCPDISQTSCSTMYKVTKSSTAITKVEEYGVPTVKSDIRSTYTNASEGTEIREDDILAFYVWIPRYKYRVWNISKQAGAESTYAYNAKTEGIDIVFESGKESTGTISCTYNYNVDSANGGVDLSTTTAETCTGSNGDYYTHPAFTFGSDELRGFWISKFEISSSDPAAEYGGGPVIDLIVRSLPNVNSWRMIQVSNINTVIQNMQTSSNIYGLNTSRTNTDSHMLTNYEWGAVAYLTNSRYGRCTDGSCTEVTINNCKTYVTGIGADSVSASSSSTTCTTAANKYNGAKGVLASTTGNITGVYDMSGGAYEYVMGNISSVTTGYTFYPSRSGFASSWYTTSTAKYVTTYVNGSSYNDQTAYNRGRLGDATAETLLSVSISGGWYSDYTIFPYYSYSGGWFIRGGYFDGGSSAGVFYFYDDRGTHSADHSSRAALVSLSA